MTARRLAIVAAAAVLALVGVASGAGDARAQEPNPAGLPAENLRPVTITIPKTKFNFGEEFRACVTYPTPASVILTRQIEGQLTVRVFRRFVEQQPRENPQCFGIAAGTLDSNCTNDVAGLESIKCVSGVSGTECLHLAVLTRLASSSSGGDRLVLVEEARACYDVG